MVLPPVTEQAVPKVTLPQRPELEPFTEQEMKQIPMTAHGKILKNQAEWWGYADIADNAVKVLKDYIKDAFKIKDKK